MGKSNMIEKPSIIITSGGRTGTAFFTRFFSDVMDSCISLHEPENLGFKNLSENLWKMRRFGVWNCVVRKMLGKWGITSISHRRMSGELGVEEAAKLLLQERGEFIQAFPQNIYLESSYHYYGLVDVLPEVFKNHRLIYIVRDGRDWVRSHMNKKEWYHRNNPHTLFGTRISPKIIGDIRYESEWASMSRFEKLCWSWAVINEYAIKTIRKNPSARLFYFEKLFESKNRYDNLRDLVDFANSLPGSSQILVLRGRLEEKINPSVSCEFPPWRDWHHEYVAQFNRICGSLMSDLGYGNEKEWSG